MEQYLLNLSDPPEDGSDEAAIIRPNIWLLSCDEIPPILFTPEEVARLLGVGRARVFDLMRRNDLHSVKIGASRRISAQALSRYVDRLELQEPA